jgi:hypothetical protein
MAQEISQSASLAVTNGNFKIPKLGGATNRITQNSPGGGVPGFVLATTGGVNVDTTGVTTLGWCYIKNTDPTNYVEWGPEDTAVFYPIGRLNPGEEIAIRLSPGKTLHLQANTATCKVQVLILEN